MSISPSPFTPETLVSRHGFGSCVPRQPAHSHTQAESGTVPCTYLRDSSRFPLCSTGKSTSFPNVTKRNKYKDHQDRTKHQRKGIERETKHYKDVRSLHPSLYGIESEKNTGGSAKRAYLCRTPPLNSPPATLGNDRLQVGRKRVFSCESL